MDADRKPVGIPIAFWLIPAEADRIGPDGLDARIARLAAEHGSFAFDPHLSLHVDRVPADVDVATLLASIAARHRPLTLRAGDLAHSDRYYQTLTIEFPAERGRADADASADAESAAGHAGLRALQQALAFALHRDAAAAQAAIAGFPLRPHLSLLYARLDADRRARLAVREDHAGRRIGFDTIAAVRPAAGFADLDDVDRWHVFGHCRLTGKT